MTIVTGLMRIYARASVRKYLKSLSADNYDWCIVPESGFDIILFAGVAVVVSCLFRGKFSNFMILVAGMTC